MWFKLAAADFSAKNLGKMADISNSYSINYNISGFTKTVAPPSVTKGETISEITLTLQENYEMNSTATLSYDSTSVNATVSGSTYKWTDITPTGSVTITAKATWVGTGEEPGGSEGGGEPTPGSTILLSSSGATLVEGKTLASGSYSMTDKENYFVYDAIPVTSGVTYQSSNGAGRIWFLTSDKTGLSTKNIYTDTPQYQFTVPSGASYVSIAFAELFEGTTPMADAATASITIVSTNNDNSDSVLETIIIADTTATLQDGKNLGTGNATTLSDKTGYFTYMNIPVQPSTTYKSQGGTRLWFVDSSGTGISSLNIYKSEGGDQYEFTTPANCTHVNISYCADGLITPIPVASTVTLERYS